MMILSDKKRFIAVVMVLALIVLTPVVAATTSSYSSSNSTASGITTASTDTGVENIIPPCNCSDNLHRIWPTYNTLWALTNASEVVVIANVTSADTIGVNETSLIYTEALLPVTVYNITITTVISPTDSSYEPGSQLSVAQIGGTFDHTTMNLTGYPTLSAGYSYVFFLTTQISIPLAYNGFFLTAGGPQGLFYIQGGDVYSLNNMYQADSWFQVTASGTPLSQFVTEVQSASSSTTVSTVSSIVSESSFTTNSTSQSQSSSTGYGIVIVAVVLIIVVAVMAYNLMGWRRQASQYESL